MARTINQRMTVQFEGDFVVFIIGMRINRFWKFHKWLPVAMAMRVPDNISFEEAAAIPEAFLTAYLAIIKLAQLKSNETVLVHAGASGVGSAAIQLVRESGGETFITAGSAEKLALCMSLGAKLAILKQISKPILATGAMNTLLQK